MSKKYSDQQLMEHIKAGGRRREDAANYMIRQFSGYMFKVKQKIGLSSEDVQDSYTDTIITVLDHINRGVFKSQSKLSTYFYRILYNKSVDLARQNSTNKQKQQIETIQPIADPRQNLLKNLIGKDDFSFLMVHIQQLGEKCSQILLDWGYWGYSMTEIATRSKLSSADRAKKEKYKCLQKLKASFAHTRKASK